MIAECARPARIRIFRLDAPPAPLSAWSRKARFDRAADTQPVPTAPGRVPGAATALAVTALAATVHAQSNSKRCSGDENTSVASAMRAGILRSRAKINDWACTVEFEVDDEVNRNGHSKGKMHDLHLQPDHVC